jgi:hypothetical protein
MMPHQYGVGARAPPASPETRAHVVKLDPKIGETAVIDRNKYRNARFLKTDELSTPRVVVTVAGCHEEELETDGGETKLKLAVEFAEFPKPLILNVTNLDALCELLGEDETAWAGRRVALVKRRVDFQGKRTDAIRIEAA